jgi:SMODS and SLOG-associating 2TM effector domain 2
MAIREATTSVQAPTPGQRPDRRRRRRDLRAGPIPAAALEQWQNTEAALTQLYRYAESRAIDAIDWYLADKRGKRIWSRGLRLVVIRLSPRRPPAPAGRRRPRAQPHRLGLRAARPGRGLRRVRPGSSASPRAGCAP